MYRIRAVCQNPACHTAFGVEFPETGPIETKTPEKAFQLCAILHETSSVNETSYIMANYTKVKLPKFIKCPKCHSLFLADSFQFLVYDAAAQDKPALDMHVVEL